MKEAKRFLLTTLLFFTGFCGFAQNEVEMADNFRAEGKIYVVVAIVLAILLGLIIYLFMLDKKLGRIEKQLEKK